MMPGTRDNWSPVATEEEHALTSEEFEIQERRTMTTLQKLQNSQCVTDIVFGVGMLLLFGLNLAFYVWASVSRP